MVKGARLSNSTLGVIIGLALSVWWIFMGLDTGFLFQASDQISYVLTLGEKRHTIMTIFALILIPVTALEIRWTFSVTMTLGIVTFLLSVIHVVYMLIAKTPGFESQIFGPTIWSVIQIIIIFFSYRARQQMSKAPD